MNADFVPVALKAGLVNNPPNDEEGRLYREIGRSKILPQGICVINSACKVLAWVEFFDDNKSVVAFLDHCLKRAARFPDAKKPFPAPTPCLRLGLVAILLPMPALPIAPTRLLLYACYTLDP